MDSPEPETTLPATSNVPNTSFRTRLMKPVTRMGGTATKAVMGARNMLTRDVKIPGAETLLGEIGTVTKPAIDNSKAIQDLKRIVTRSREVLISGVTVFPPKLFQDSIIVDRTKVTIIKRSFLWSADVISIRIEDILNVSTSVGPIFGSLNISSRVMNSTDHFQIGAFFRGTAIDIKHIIQGYMIARNNNIDTDHLTVKELTDTLSELGRDSAR